MTSKQIEDFISKELKLDLTSFFNQYVRDSRIPVFEYKWIDNKLIYRWANCITEFDMPLPVYFDSEAHVLTPTTEWQVMGSDEVVSDFILLVNSTFLCTLKKL